MARVPLLEGQRVQTAPMPDVRMDPRAFGSDIAQGLTQAGQALGNVAEDLQKVEDQRIKTAVMQRDVEWMTFDREQRVGENGLFKKAGQAAVDARPVIEQAYTAKRDELLKSASTVREREVLNDLLTRRYQSSLDSINEYASRETVAAQRGAAGARASLAGEAFALVLRSETDPTRIAEARAVYDGAMSDMHDSLGIGSAEREVDRLARTGAIHGAVLESMLAEDKPEEAEVYLERYGSEMTLAQRTAAGPKVSEQSAKRDAEILMTEGVEGLPHDGSGFIMPVAGDVGSGFGPRKAPLPGASTFHTGVDIKAPAGSPVKATAAGEVIEVGSNAKSGNFVRIKHADGRISSYSHLASYGVEQGDQLAGGSVLGKVGSTGNSTGPHLHFSLTDVDGETKIDPRTVMGRPPPPKPGPDATQEEWRQYADALAGGNRKRRDVYRAAGQGEWLRNQAIIREREQKASDAVQPYLADGSGVTSWTQIPQSVLGALSPQQLTAVKNSFAAASAKATGQTDPVVYSQLYDMVAQDPKGFKEAELLKLVDKLSPSDFQEVVKLQLSMRREQPAAAAKQLSLETTNRVAGLIMPPKLKPADQALFKSALYQTALKAEALTGKPLTEKELMDLGNRLAVKQAGGRELYEFGSRTVKGEGMAVGFNDIPKADVDRLVADYRKKNPGQTPNKGQVVEAWRVLKATGRL